MQPFSPSKAIGVLACFLASANCYSQIDRITEITDRKRIDVSVETPAIVDINSILEIDLNRLRFSKDLAPLSVNAELEKQIIVLDSILGLRTEITPLLETILSRLETGDTLKLQARYAQLSKKVDDIVINHKFLRDAYNTIAANPDPIAEVGLQNILLGFAKLQKQLIDQLPEGKNNIRLKAYLVQSGKAHQRIHITNFDSFENDGFTIIDGSTTIIPEALKKTLQSSELKNLESDLGLKRITDKILNDVKSLSSISCLKNLKMNLDADPSKPISKLIRADITELTTQLPQIPKMKVNSADEAFRVRGQLEKANDHLKNIIEQIDQGKPTTISTKECIRTFINDSTLLDRLVSVSRQVENTAEINSALDQSGEFFAFNSSNLPGKAYLDCKNIPNRKSNDQVVIQVILVKEQLNDIDREEVIQQVSLTVKQVKAYAIGTGGIIFANPYNSTESPQFRLSPSTSLLFKGDSRTSEFWNFLQPGIGFNISAPDLDTNFIPDLATGIIVTGFKDVVSFGTSYDISSNSFFWFFGLNIPLVNLPVVNKIKDEIP